MYSVNLMSISAFMKHLLSVYGNMTVYLDATHNVCDYADISLFIFAVRTNCVFQVLL